VSPEFSSAADDRPDPPAAILAALPAALAGVLAGRYRFDRELGRGGMATVFLVLDLRHDRPVALKVLQPELGQVLGAERFRREIRTAARLQHPHILAVHDSGEEAELLWFTMPFVAGESLRDRLRREGPLPIPEAVRLTREVAGALDYAHRHGVIHRDVKPENILLAEDGAALLADFGIARAGESASEASALTATGVSIGTPAYMSPEQVAGERSVDGRSDIYSLACVLYELLAGEAPFTGPNTQAILAKRMSGDVPRVRTVRPAVPEELEAALRRALALVPADRFATAADFGRALAADSGGGSAATVLTPGHPRAVAPRPLVRRQRLGAALLLTLLVGAGLFFGWRWVRPRGATTAAAPGVVRLAVLPFENLGRPEDAYFADGMTDEIRGKLATLAQFQVIARASSNEYRGLVKPQRTIAKELDVRYLLTGTVRTDPRAGGLPTRIRVHPELVDVSPGSAPTSRWQEPFQAEMADVFQVQADIAERVAQALDIALAVGTRQKLAAQPTTNLQAYDLYLQAEQASNGFSGDPVPTARAVELYQRAVALDPSFAVAWAHLAVSRALLYSNLPTHSAGATEAVRSAASKAVALASQSPDAWYAMGTYFWAVEHDPRRGAEQFGQGLRVAPNNPMLLTYAGLAEAALGRWEEALRHSQRAARLDPRAINPARAPGYLLLWLRRYPEARTASDSALALAPSDLLTIQQRAMEDLAQGDLAAARQVLAAAPKEVDQADLAAYMAAVWDLGWVLDDAGQRRVLSLGPAAFSNDRVDWGLALAQMHALRGNMGEARAFAGTARRAAEEALRTSPDDPQLHTLSGVALAYLGQRDSAVREGERGVALMPVNKDATMGPYLQHQLARIYVLLGENEKALDQLEELMTIPYYLSPGWLRIDPTFAPLRGNPRFQRLLQGTG